MKVFEPLRTYSSPSRRAVAFIDPKASEPLPGSVIAHAPILSRVSRSRAQRSFCAVVPLLMIAADVSPIDDAHRRDQARAAAAQLDDRDHRHADAAAAAALAVLVGHRL